MTATDAFEALALPTGFNLIGVIVPVGSHAASRKDAERIIDRYCYGAFKVTAVELDEDAENWVVQITHTVYGETELPGVRVESQLDRLRSGNYRAHVLRSYPAADLS